MARIKRGIISRQKHKKILKLAKGYRMSRHRLIKSAKEAVLHAGQYAYIGRKNRKRDFRRLWIDRINQAVRPFDLNYSQFMNKLKKANIILNRKILAFLIAEDSQTFKTIVDKIKNNGETIKTD